MGRATVKKAGGGGAAAAPKALAKKHSRADLTVDEETKAKRQKQKEEQAEKRKLKQDEKKVDQGFESVGDVSFMQDLDQIVQWAKLPQNMKYAPFIHSLIRNGLLEKSFSRQQEKLPEVLGPRLVSEAGCKWRHLGGMACARIVAKVLDKPEILEWFKGSQDEKLSYDIAHKMLLYMMGVSDNAPMPTGHVHCAYELPLVWLCKKRWEQVGKRLENVTKATADSHSDYWVLSAAGSKLQATFDKMDAVKLPFKLSIATDFVIVNPHQYAGAQLISEKEGVDQNIARAWQEDHEAPTFDEAFNYPEKTDLNAKELDFEASAADGSGAALLATSPAKPGIGGLGALSPAMATARRPPKSG